MADVCTAGEMGAKNRCDSLDPGCGARRALLASSLEELQESGLGVVLDVRLGGCVGGSGRAAGDDKIEASTLGVDDGEHGGQISAGRGWRGGENVPDPLPREGRTEAEDLCTHMCTLFTF